MVRSRFRSAVVLASISMLQLTLGAFSPACRTDAVEAMASARGAVSGDAAPCDDATMAAGREHAPEQDPGSDAPGGPDAADECRATAPCGAAFAETSPGEGRDVTFCAAETTTFARIIPDSVDLSPDLPPPRA